ncbi:cystathionine beta-synthase [Candidatus Nomurabacteria bacterium CG22_combo_CG10-13_8_21_14_all_32_8]|uniref:Cystathionine beta-synthase n=3 Tax=Candidatus Nomuraibacteriota TaxID=1752729 RepID=A0A2H0CGB4_9BACT|nr:MAG: cystathionine beta-synthase [Candidatus Nomurabacteria bacterium CG22_combo_CG10-13_8_21_14_all_32_8]
MLENLTLIIKVYILKYIMRKQSDNLLKIIGNTPLVRVSFNTKVKIFAKLEYLNPGGSIKDRSALFMIEEAERKGLLKPGGTIIESSSGNQGIACAMIGAIKGYKVIITASPSMSEEKIKTIKAYGAKVINCPAVPISDSKSRHSQAILLTKKIKNSFMPNQYFNLSNPKAHYRSLGPEIWEQTNGKITHFFAAAGTGGTISGAGKFLKEKNPKIKIMAVDIDTSFHSTKGHPKPYKMEGIGIDFKTHCLNESIIDKFFPVSDKNGLGMLPVMASKYGLLIGTGSGAVSYAVQNYLSKLKKNDVVVMLFGDSGRAYLSKNYF